MKLYVYMYIIHKNIHFWRFLGYVFLLASSEVIFEEETLIYDFISFVSEFGGSLGLFLGFSFFMLASNIPPLYVIVRNFFKQL